MRKLVLYTRITLVVLALFLGFLLVHGLHKLSDAKAKVSRCSATTNGTITSAWDTHNHRGPDDNSVNYSFTVDGAEYSFHRLYEHTLGEKSFTEGPVTIHYNPEKTYEHYLGDKCYEVESAKDELFYTFLMWGLYLIGVTIHIVRCIKTPEYYDD